MTAGAGADYLSVIDACGWLPEGYRVTAFTGVAGGDVSQRFAGGSSAVVATYAVAGNVDVIEVRRCPGVGCMAVITGAIGGDVIGRLA